MKFPKPFFRKAKHAWYLQLGKRQISLGPDRDKAFERYQEVLLHERGQIGAAWACDTPRQTRLGCAPNTATQLGSGKVLRSHRPRCVGPPHAWDFGQACRRLVRKCGSPVAPTRLTATGILRKCF